MPSTLDMEVMATSLVRSESSRSNASSSRRPSSVTSTNFSSSPTSRASICQGTRFEWCSSRVTTTSSPGLRNVRPQDCATRLIDSVVPRVKTIWAGSAAPMNRATRARADSIGLGGPLAQGVQAAMDVGRILGVVALHGADDRPGLQARGGAVQVDQRHAGPHVLVDRGEVFPDRFRIERGRPRPAIVLHRRSQPVACDVGRHRGRSPRTVSVIWCRGEPGCRFRCHRANPP